MLWSPKRSLASHVMAWLGCRLIVAPAAIQAPADFYYEPGDRDLPPRTEMQRPEVQRDRIRVDAIRRALFERVALLSCVFGLALCVAMLLAASAIGGLGNAISGPPELTGLQQLRCANLNAIPEQNRSTSQRAEFARTCSRWTP